MSTGDSRDTLQELDALDFTALFASQIHDLKNLLFLLLNDLDNTLDRHAGVGIDADAQARLALLKYNGQLINDKLIQMLSLYRFNRNAYPVNLEHRPAAELIEDIVAETSPLLAAKSIRLTSQVAPDLCWFYDRDLAAGVLNNAIHNALNCARSEIRLSADTEDGYLIIRVEDDGDGFPEEILGNGGNVRSLDISGGKTGLGLYFSSVCARLHTNKERIGRIELGNGGSLGGAVFALLLP
ncbi:MAG: HAMP domain-containing histidine kinase [Betaproteobacteria bacterium]|nr:HAMP domain-containing histidine kinase [Betaproteobacteria bacterium]